LAINQYVIVLASGRVQSDDPLALARYAHFQSSRQLLRRHAAFFGELIRWYRAGQANSGAQTPAASRLQKKAISPEVAGLGCADLPGVL